MRTDGSLAVRGWAVCAAGIAQVRVLSDEIDLGLAVFGYERPDVAAIHADIPMAGLSGFKFERSLGQRFEGEHTVRVMVSNARTGKNDHCLLVVAAAIDEEPPNPV